MGIHSLPKFRVKKMNRPENNKTKKLVDIKEFIYNKVYLRHEYAYRISQPFSFIKEDERMLKILFNGCFHRMTISKM